jgi:hypothetical protein
MAEAPDDQAADPITQPLAVGPVYDPTSDREKIRGRLAQILIWAVVVVTVGALGMLAMGRITVQDLPTVMGAASPLVGIAGAAIGFYFGGEDRRRS